MPSDDAGNVTFHESSIYLAQCSECGTVRPCYIARNVAMLACPCKNVVREFQIVDGALKEVKKNVHGEWRSKGDE